MEQTKPWTSGCPSGLAKRGFPQRDLWRTAKGVHRGGAQGTGRTRIFGFILNSRVNNHDVMSWACESCRGKGIALRGMRGWLQRMDCCVLMEREKASQGLAGQVTTLPSQICSTAGQLDVYDYASA